LEMNPGRLISFTLKVEFSHTMPSHLQQLLPTHFAMRPDVSIWIPFLKLIKASMSLGLQASMVLLVCPKNTITVNIAITFISWWFMLLYQMEVVLKKCCYLESAMVLKKCLFSFREKKSSRRMIKGCLKI
jgi:hypothetical protein